MKKKLTIVSMILLGLGLTSLAAWYLHDKQFAVLQPHGSVGTHERNLMVFTVLLGLVIIVPVFVMTIAIAWRYRESNHKATYKPEWDRHRLAEFTWWAVPIAIITILAVATWVSSYALDPWKALASDKKPLTIQVVALDWKWLFIYPEQHIATVNYVQIPTGTPVAFKTTSDTVMNSFWIPQLGSQIYSMPGMSTTVNLQATADGTYRGSSANISGQGFAGMHFTVKSTSQADFTNWIRRAKQSPKHLDQAAYASLAKPSKENPVAYYSSPDPQLYDTIMMRYMMPMPSSEATSHDGPDDGSHGEAMRMSDLDMPPSTMADTQIMHHGGDH